jgi:hypothetical protein
MSFFVVDAAGSEGHSQLRIAASGLRSGNRMLI